MLQSSRPANTSSKPSSLVTNLKPSPSKSYLDLLPPELKTEIFCHLDSPADVRSLAHAFPSFKAVRRLNKRQIDTSVQRQRIHPETLDMCQELYLRGLRGIRDLLNPSPFESFDVLIPKTTGLLATECDEIACAVRDLFLQARSGDRIRLCARDRVALSKVVAVAGATKGRWLVDFPVERFGDDRNNPEALRKVVAFARDMMEGGRRRGRRRRDFVTELHVARRAGRVHFVETRLQFGVFDRRVHRWISVTGAGHLRVL